MISFTREGTKVKISITVPVPNESSRTFYCYWEANAEWAAGLLVELFNNTFRDRIAVSRQSSYEDGWKDAKAKRQKATRFLGWLNIK